MRGIDFINVGGPLDQHPVWNSGAAGPRRLRTSWWQCAGSCYWEPSGAGSGSGLMIRGPICSLNTSTSISTKLPEDNGALCVQEVARVATRIGHAQFHDGCPWTIDLMNVGGGEWQLASSLVSLMSDGSGEWQLASGWIRRLNEGNGEWQVASSLLSRIDDGAPSKVSAFLPLMGSSAVSRSRPSCL